jgi:thiamine-phosphate diphosphorylase
MRDDRVVLPTLVVVTDGAQTGGRPLLDVVAAAVAGGARAVLMREKHLPRSERQRLATELRKLLAPLGGLLIVGSDPTIPADGLHLSAADDLPGSPPPLLGRSCHSPAEVAAAAAQGCRYATLSPVFSTRSKPGYGPALGPGALRGLPLPVWALGGVEPSNAGDCLRAGAAGVAVMGFVMRAEDPARAAADLCEALVAAGTGRP